MDYPANVRLAYTAATVAVFTALIVGSNLALSDVPNFKLDAALIFLTTIVFGAYAGASVAVLSELIWSQVSPWGASGAYLLPFLISAELLYVLAALIAKRMVEGKWQEGGDSGVLFAGLLCMSTVAWDLWTNLGTAVLTTNLSLGAVMFVEFNPYSLIFSVTHEVSNLILGAALVPAALVVLPKISGGRLRDAV